MPRACIYGSPAQSKIALFRSLFRGREDVYPRRFESLRTGKSGYAPACANEWRPGVCEKPRIRCAVCPNRQFLPVTDDVIHWHLTGADDAGEPCTAGVYPMLLDETCHLLAVDFDGKTWEDDASAYLSTCTTRGVPAALERSRSGNGGHVWLFFDTAVAAGLARRLGALLLTETMDDRPDLGFRSYDRFFPSQDTLPHGGFGNLIALPLQGKPRMSSNSVFVDTDLNPFADQWAYLSQLGRVPASRAESLVREAEKDGRVLGVKAVERDEPACLCTVEGAAVASAPQSAGDRPPSRSCRDCARRRNLHREAGHPSRHRHTADAPGGVSESRVLPRTGHAPPHLRDTENRRLRGGWPQVHPASAGVSGRCPTPAATFRHQAVHR